MPPNLGLKKVTKDIRGIYGDCQKLLERGLSLCLVKFFLFLVLSVFSKKLVF